MIKLIVGLALGMVLLLQSALPARAAWGSSPSEIIYNYNAGDSEAALTIVLSGGRGKETLVVKGNEFKAKTIQGQLETTQQVEDRIQRVLLDSYFIEFTKLTTFPADDPVRQDPPILSENERIVVINNSEYLAFYKCFFELHIYSIDNPATPESELRFITIFSSLPIEDGWW